MKKCSHLWHVRKQNNIPNGYIIDCEMECDLCGKMTSGLIFIDKEES